MKDNPHEVIETQSQVKKYIGSKNVHVVTSTSMYKNGIQLSWYVQMPHPP